MTWEPKKVVGPKEVVGYSACGSCCILFLLAVLFLYVFFSVFDFKNRQAHDAFGPVIFHEVPPQPGQS